MLRVVLELTALALALVAAAAAATRARILRQARVTTCGNADAIVVFGAALWDGRPSPELAARLHRAAALHRAGRAPLVVCSGGDCEGRSEARAMREELLRLGVPAEAIAVDEQGVSTRRTLARAARAFERVIAVSSPYHVLRISREARRHRLVALPEPSAWRPRGRGLRRLRAEAREIAAVWWYSLRAPDTRRLRLRRERPARPRRAPPRRSTERGDFPRRGRHARRKPPRSAPGGAS